MKFVKNNLIFCRILSQFKVKRNKEFIATSIQEIFNPYQAAAQMSQPIDLQKLFMHQMSVPPQLISPQNLAIQQEFAMQQMQQAAAAAAAAATANINGNSANPLLNGCTTMVTNTNINVTYLNGAIANKYDHKMHQGFIAVLKVKKLQQNYLLVFLN